MVNDSESGEDFVAACVDMTGCVKGTYYSGIGSHDVKAGLHLLMTCHKCSATDFIPTVTNKIILDTKSSTTFMKQFFAVDCMKKGEPTSSTGSTIKFIDNCAVQEIVNGIPQWLGYLDENPHPNPVCIACDPGHKAVNSSTIKEGLINFNITYSIILITKKLIVKGLTPSSKSVN